MSNNKVEDHSSILEHMLLDLTLWMMDNYEPESVMDQFFKLGQKQMQLMLGILGTPKHLQSKILHLVILR